MEQDKLKSLLKTAVHEIETGKFSSLEEIISVMEQAFREFMPAFGEKS